MYPQSTRSSRRFANPNRPLAVRGARAEAVFGHTLRGDRHGDHVLAECAERWSVGGEVTFVDVRQCMRGAGYVVTALRFDRRGAGTTITAHVALGESLDEQLAEFTADASHMVAVGAPPDGLRALFGAGITYETRDDEEVGRFEVAACGGQRPQSSALGSVVSAACAGDRVALRRVARRARTRVFSLVAMAGARVSVH